eukprot:scaffold1181_cov67-Cyclotella_meneghiniana.AAC.11
MASPMRLRKKSLNNRQMVARAKRYELEPCKKVVSPTIVVLDCSHTSITSPRVSCSQDSPNARRHHCSRGRSSQSLNAQININHIGTQ